MDGRRRQRQPGQRQDDEGHDLAPHRRPPRHTHRRFSSNDGTMPAQVAITLATTGATASRLVDGDEVGGVAGAEEQRLQLCEPAGRRRVEGVGPPGRAETPQVQHAVAARRPRTAGRTQAASPARPRTRAGRHRPDPEDGIGAGRIGAVALGGAGGSSRRVVVMAAIVGRPPPRGLGAALEDAQNGGGAAVRRQCRRRHRLFERASRRRRGAASTQNANPWRNRPSGSMASFTATSRR